MRRRFHAEILRLLGDPTRLVILDRLARKPRTAGEMARQMPVTRTAIVQHLGRLKAAGLVTAVAEGRRQVYRVAPIGLAPLKAWLEKIGI